MTVFEVAPVLGRERRQNSPSSAASLVLSMPAPSSRYSPWAAARGVAARPSGRAGGSLLRKLSSRRSWLSNPARRLADSDIDARRIKRRQEIEILRDLVGL